MSQKTLVTQYNRMGLLVRLLIRIYYNKMYSIDDDR